MALALSCAIACNSSRTPAIDLAAPPDLTTRRSDLAAPPDLTGTPKHDLSQGGQDLAGVDLRENPMPQFVSGVTVSTLAGGSSPGIMDGMGAAATFTNPTGIDLSQDGSLIVSDYDSGHIRRVTAAGAVTTLVGTTIGFAFPYAAIATTQGQSIVGTDADSAGMKSDKSGTLWIVPATPGSPIVLSVGWGRPRGLAVLNDGRIFVSDLRNHTVSLLEPVSGQVTPLAGVAGQAGYAEGNGAHALFNEPGGCAILPDGSVLVADFGNHRVRQVTLSGDVTTYAGDGVADTWDGDRQAARFNQPGEIAVDGMGNAYVTDRGDRRVRVIYADGRVRTLAGDGTAGYSEGTAGSGSGAQFYGLEGIAVTANGKTVYVTDGNQGDGSMHHRVRKLVIP